MTKATEIEAVIEAALFASGEPLPKRRLVELFPDAEREAVLAAIDRVTGRYRGAAGQGIRAEEVGGGIRLVTRPELHDYLRRLLDLSGRNRLSMAALETLAIVAYRQPITAPEIQDLRGVNSSGVLKTLLERRLVRISGRKMVVGKPFLYATTRDFLIHFGLRKLDELPPLEEFEELLGQMGERGAPAETVSGARTEEILGPEPVAELEDGGEDERGGDEEE